MSLQVTHDVAQLIVSACMEQRVWTEMVSQLKVLRKINSVFREAFDRDHFGAKWLLQRLLEVRTRCREHSDYLSNTLEPALRWTQRFEHVAFSDAAGRACCS